MRPYSCHELLQHGLVEEDGEGGRRALSRAESRFKFFRHIITGETHRIYFARL